MKLAYIVSEFPSLSQTFILSQITGLLDEGHAVDVYAARPGTEPVQHPDVARYRLLERTRYRKTFAVVTGRARRIVKAAAILARDPWLLRRWLRVLRRDGAYAALDLLFAAAPFREGRYDAIVAHFGPTGAAWVRVKDLTETPLVCAFYGYDVTSYVREHGPAAYAELFRRGDAFLALSRCMASQLEAMGCPSDRIVIHPLGIDPSRFASSGAAPRSGGPLRLLSVARLVEKKGLADAIEAVARLAAGGTPVEYVIAGSGPLEESLRALIGARGLERSVTLAGPKPSDAIAALMAATDVFLLPSITASDGDQEGTPTVLLEAQACGLPVLSTRHSGIPEIVVDGQSGYLVPEHDVTALAERLTFLAEHPEVRAQLGAFGRRWAAERFDTRALCRRLAGIFEGLARSGQVSVPAQADLSPAAGPDLTVLLPTRNRAAQARESLQRLAVQETGGAFTYEVLVADNGSTDGTRAAVDALSAGYPVPLRYLREERAGKSYALNTAIRAARGAVLVMLDDDILISPGWLRALWTCLSQEPSDAVCGRVLPEWGAARPAWLEEAVSAHLNQTGLGCIDHGTARRRTADGQDCRWVGGNMAIRREAALRVGGFHTALARGQDSDYYRRCVAAGLRIVYEPAALARHYVGPERLSVEALRQWRHRQGYYEAMLLPWKPSHALTVMPLWCWAQTLKALWAWLVSRLRGGSRWERFYAGLKVREQFGAWAYRLQHWPGWGRESRAHG